MENEIVKVYVVKYALTKGIFEMQAREIEGKYYEHVDGARHGFYTIRDIAFTPEVAAVMARDMAAHKAKSLRKQLDRVLDLKQTPKWAK